MEGDAELKLQKASSELIRDFERLLTRYLRKRKVVQHSRTNDLVKLLEPFQEWPQLLDPHLKRLLPPLITAFLEYLTKRPDQYQITDERNSEDEIPIPRGLSRILYTLCKIRGYKVISYFFSNEPKYLEPMLNAYEMWTLAGGPNKGQDSHSLSLTWEEKYIMLLWISHLALTPFPLAAISSTGDVNYGDLPINLSDEAPSIVGQITHIAISNVGAASKEREAAGILLARVALRPDMRQYGLLSSTIEWALASLETSDENGRRSIYAYIGALSFLSGVVTSADSSIIGSFLLRIFESIQAIASQESAHQKAIYSSALARKLVIKVFRAITIHVLLLQGEVSTTSMLSVEDTLENVIDYLITSLADRDTPVRYAASKALSIVTVKLDATLSAEIVEALIGGLEDNTSWQDLTTGQMVTSHVAQSRGLKSLKPVLTAVNPLKWHGLVLALSQLLYRRSPPPSQLPSILNALITALSFEQRSSVGASIGTNVRDAACFGIWALARRYTTKELLAVDTSLIRVAGGQEQSVSVLQILANQMVVAACLDSSGNIRRGSSAALQELIGRHPDTIEQGISVVQIVDYHAVALRSRAVIEVALQASNLDRLYWDSLLDGLLDSRGIGSADVSSRRDAATALGELSRKDLEKGLRKVRESLRSTANRQVEERHGLLLALAEIVLGIKEYNVENQGIAPLNSLTAMSSIFEDVGLVDNDFTTGTLRPHLTAEAMCRVIAAFGSATRSSTPISMLIKELFIASSDDSRRFLGLALRRTEEEVIDAATTAARELFHFQDISASEALINSWISALDQKRPRSKPYGIIAALGAIFRHSPASYSASERILANFIEQLKPPTQIETRVWTVRSLASCIRRIESTAILPVIEALSRCLDDYTTDQRGDVGSLLRLEAINAVDSVLNHHAPLNLPCQKLLLSRICRLSVEKLDKVRKRAWSCLQKHHKLLTTNPFPDYASTSSSEYFLTILTLTYSHQYLLAPILTGLATSTTSGSDALIRASRSALSTHIETLPKSQVADLLSCLLDILTENQHDERLSLPTIALLAFLVDINIYDQLTSPEGVHFDWQRMFTLLAKCHYKSTNVRKIVSCISCYAGLARIPPVEEFVVLKLCNLLSHPYPTVRSSTPFMMNSVYREEESLIFRKFRFVTQLLMHYTSLSLRAMY